MSDILDFAIVGNRLFTDDTLAAKGPMAWYEDRIAAIRAAGLDPKRHDLIAKWWTGSQPAAGGKARWDMRGVAPQAWLDGLPAVFARAKADYRMVTAYTGALQNATPAAVRELCHWYIDVCGADRLAIDAAGTLPNIERGKLTVPAMSNLHAVEVECAERGVELSAEPPPMVDTFQALGLWVYMEDIFRDGKWTGEWYYRHTGANERAMPPKHKGYAVCALADFDHAHADKRLAQGWSVAANFRSPGVQKWALAKAVANG